MPDKSNHADMLRHRTPPGLKRTGIFMACVAVVVAAAGIGLRIHNDRQTVTWTNNQTIASVEVLKLKTVKAGGDLSLPGDVQAFTNAPIYAQVAGYMKKWYFDIGAPVKAGQLLAQIDPRTYQAALDQAKGTLARDSATLANAKVDLARYQSLAAQNAISSQQLAAAQTNVNADTGIVATDRAAVETATINLGYTGIKAPFDGIVTSRSVDVGNLVTVGTAAATNPLFTVTDRTKLRVYVHVPEVYSGLLKPGLDAEFSVSEYPGRKFHAVLAASSGAMSSANGTQLAQFAFDNKDNLLKPGDYADVHIKLPAARGSIRLPATALLFRDSGMMIATVDPTSHVHLKNITIGADLGNVVEINNGVSPSDQVIDNPPDSIREGAPVQVMTPSDSTHN